MYNMTAFVYVYVKAKIKTKTKREKYAKESKLILQSVHKKLNGRRAQPTGNAKTQQTHTQGHWKCKLYFVRRLGIYMHCKFCCVV